MEMLMYTKP